MIIVNTVKKIQHEIDANAERFLFHHPLLGSLVIFIGMPLLVLAGVCASMMLLSFPITALLGLL